jgi:hypothetical protein
MELKDFRLISALIALLALSLCRLHSQKVVSYPDSIFMKFFDSELHVKFISAKKLFKKPTVIISSTNCIACTEYFTRHKQKFNYVFVLGNESLAEIKRILDHHLLKKDEVLFTTCKYVSTEKDAICKSPTPCMVYLHNKKANFYTYSELNNVTKEFSLKISLLRKKLNE